MDLSFLNLDELAAGQTATVDEIGELLGSIPNETRDWWELENICHAIMNASGGERGEDQRLLFLWWASKNPEYTEKFGEEAWRKVSRQRSRIEIVGLDYLKARAAGSPPLGKLKGQNFKGHPAFSGH